MTTTTMHSYKLSLKRATKRTRTTSRRRSRRRSHPLSQNLITTIDPSTHEKCHKNSQKLSQKLEALKNLIPTTNTTEEEAVKPDQLFKETADYIVLLRTRVVVLQKLIEYYGNNSTQNDEHALLLQ